MYWTTIPTNQESAKSLQAHSSHIPGPLIGVTSSTRIRYLDYLMPLTGRGWKLAEQQTVVFWVWPRLPYLTLFCCLAQPHLPSKWPSPFELDFLATVSYKNVNYCPRLYLDYTVLPEKEIQIANHNLHIFFRFCWKTVSRHLAFLHWAKCWGKKLFPLVSPKNFVV